MRIETKSDILAVLRMPYAEYLDTVMPYAKRLQREHNQNELIATAMLGYDNICKNQCLYCGMRAGSTGVNRFRLSPEVVIASAAAAAAAGFRRIFLVSGEDPKYGFQNLLQIVERIKALGMYISLACGEFSREQYRELAAAGANEYVLKFEMSQEDVFNRLNPSTDFRRRLQSIEQIRESGMSIASGNIIDYPGQSDEQIAEDILLMRKLEISWAPIIPYLPAKGTPLAAEGGRGSLEKTLKEISILRIMMPGIKITAQQPGENLANGLADPEGNLHALNAGANILFADMLPATLAGDFSVIDHRVTIGLDHIRRMAELSGMKLTF